jgi:long-subunit fatty acid transport protein
MPKRVFILLVLILIPPTASAQVGIAFEFSFSNPGARSMGFGGAFVALADDATAAFANPAGLVQLVDSEVSLELRHWNNPIPVTFSGRLTGAPTNIGLDTRSGIEYSTYEHTVTGPSYLSFVYPRKNWSIAFYRHLLADFEVATETQGLFAEAPGFPFDTGRLFDRRDRTDLEVFTYGVSAAFKVVETLSLGLSLNYYDGILRGFQESYFWDEDTPAGYFGPTSFLPSRLVSAAEFNADGTDIAFSAGLLWRINKNWSFGGFYRHAPTFDFDYTILGGPAALGEDLSPGETVSQQTSIRYPDVSGFGVAFRSTGGHLTLSFEWDRIEYSNIFDSLGATSSGEFIPDGNETHLGAEYAFLESRPVFALRAGMWLDRNHQVRSDIDDRILQGLLGTGGDEMHFSFGLGAAFEVIQLDFGVDISDRQDTLSLSGIYSW